MSDYRGCVLGSFASVHIQIKASDASVVKDFEARVTTKAGVKLFLIPGGPGGLWPGCIRTTFPTVLGRVSWLRQFEVELANDAGGVCCPQWVPHLAILTQAVPDPCPFVAHASGRVCVNDCLIDCGFLGDDILCELIEMVVGCALPADLLHSLRSVGG